MHKRTGRSLPRWIIARAAGQPATRSPVENRVPAAAGSAASPAQLAFSPISSTGYIKMNTAEIT